MSKFNRLLLLFLIPILLLSGCSTTPKKEKFSASFIGPFDTATQIIGYETNEKEFSKKVATLEEELNHYHKLYDIYNEYDGINNLKTVNDNAGIAPVKVEKEIIDLLEFSIELYNKTNKQVNIALGSVLSIWHEYRTHGISSPTNAALPDMDVLKDASAHTDISKIIIDKEASTVFLEDSNMSLDVGSIGKGYAVQCVADNARKQGFSNYLISVGGNVVTIDSKPDGQLWRLAIQNPDLTSDVSYVKKVDFKDQCLVTSGDYQRYYVVDGKEYCHIIDPDTLMPADYFKSVSIITAHSGLADALSTALFNMEYEEGLALINSIEGAEAMWILEDGSIQYSDNFEQYVVAE